MGYNYTIRLVRRRWYEVNKNKVLTWYEERSLMIQILFLFLKINPIFYCKPFFMQPKPTRQKSIDAGRQITSKRKTRGSKHKTNNSAIINFKEQWLDKQEILERTHISSGTLQNWRRKGLLPYSRVVGKLYYKESDLQKLLHHCSSANRT